MKAVNKVMLLGNVGSDPELKALPSGDEVANFSVATTERWKDKKTDEMKEATEWHRIVAFGKLADIIGQYVKKGTQIFIEGSLRTRSWDQDGVKKYSTEIVAKDISMLGQPSGSPSQNNGTQPSNSVPMPAPPTDEEIPF